MNNYESRSVAISRKDWSFDQIIERDEARHNEKVKESIKNNLGDVISDGSIITADPHSKKTIKIPMRSIELPRFKFGDPKEGVGTGDGTGQPGDPVDGDGDPQAGDGEPGDKPGQEYYEAEMTIEEIQQMVFADLGLPFMKPKQQQDMDSETINFNDVRKKRTTTNLDIGRTVMQNIIRNAQAGRTATVHNIQPDDYRVRTWENERKPENSAVVIAMADISGSMGEFEKYITRAFCWWTTNFLRSEYPKVELVFVAHDTEAHEVTEEQFFTRGAGGGTKCSSANRLALDIVKERYPADRYNVYPLHFSDGDNWSGDNADCVDLVQQLLDNEINQYAYVQIGARSSSGLLNEYNRKLHDERFKGLIINDKQGLLPALKRVFNPAEKAEK
ncbi:MAG: DUF444 family protein [Candidatus Saccharimonadales bacterium]